MTRPLYTLGPRLEACAKLVRPGRALIDVGTDHAYLPIWLIQTGIIPRAVACDINPGPLDAARRHGERYRVEEKLRLVLSDGLRELRPEDGDDIVIAGMGGELILRIIRETGWLCGGPVCREKRLILQPMTMADKLRLGLWELGFQVLEEQAVEDAGKVYSAFAAAHVGNLPPPHSLYPYMGELSPGGQAVQKYAEKTVRGLMNQLQGAEHGGDRQTADKLRGIVEEIREKYL